MAGAVTHTWPEDVRAAIVSAVLDQGLSQGKALKAAEAGELPNVKPCKPGRTTLAGWVQQEQNKRNREARAKVANGGLQRLAEEALARALTPVLEDCELIAAGRPSKLTKRTAEAIDRNINILKKACPQIGKPEQKRPEQQTPEHTNGAKDHDGHQASTLAERLAARANKPTNTKPPTQRETPTAQQQDHEHSEEEGESDSVSRSQGQAEPVAA